MSIPSNYDSTVNSLYLAFYGRPADPAGLKFWSQQLEKADGNLNAIVTDFANSEEAQVRFGTDTAEGRIAEIYQQLFNRAPDADGLKFWTDAIGEGRLTLANAAIEILNGAKGADNDLVDLRQKAMDSFTAQVEATGSDYAGYAAVEAARVLVRAVTLGASQDDVNNLVKSAVDFAAIATKTPAVVDAIATGSTLLGLFDTARGNADPVGLARTLADTAKAAAGSPDTLDSLLRGGGMDKVLKVMPASATLHDVVDALAAGGLPAAVEVVYPSAPVHHQPAPAPVLPMTLAFLDVDQSQADTHSDNVTNIEKVDVDFRYTGKELASSAHFEYSLDGINWATENVEVADHVVTVKGLHLGMGTPIVAAVPDMASPGIHSLSIDTHADLQTTVYLRAVDAGGAAISQPFSQQIVYDTYAAAPQVTLSNDGTVQIGGIEHGAKVEFGVETLVPIGTPTVLDPILGIPVGGGIIGMMPVTSWSSEAPAPHEGTNTYLVRQTDAAGNVSDAAEVSFTLGAQAPAKPTIALEQDTGLSSADGITKVGLLDIDGLDTAPGSSWQYRAGDDGSWTFGGANDGSGKAAFDLATLGNSFENLQVRQVDAAGHASDASNALNVIIDADAPTGTFTFDHVQGATGGDPAVTSLGQADVCFQYSGNQAWDDVFQYRVNGGEWVTLDNSAFNSASHILTVPGVDLSVSDQNVDVRVIDAAGNEGMATGKLIDSTVNDAAVPQPEPQPEPLPVASNLTDVVYHLNYGPSTIGMVSAPDSLVPADGVNSENGLNDKAGLVLKDISTGMMLDTATDYTSGDAFGVKSDGLLHFNTVLDAGVYSMSWQDTTFATSNGYLAAGDIMFAGGHDGEIYQEGFGFAYATLVTSDISAEDYDVHNDAYIDAAATGSLHIATGGGHDVVVDQGADLTIDYHVFDATAQDLILGFDAGSDVIAFHDDAATMIDHNLDGQIEWASGNGLPVVVSETTEAVEVVTSRPIAVSDDLFDQINTAQTLNASLDLHNMAPYGDLLILAKNTEGTGAALFHFNDANGDGNIEVGELTNVAVFSGGVPTESDIQLVGVQVANTGIPGEAP